MSKVTSERGRQTAVGVFFAALLVAMWAVPRVDLVRGPELRIVSPASVAGDEPHYILVLNSILQYHRLELQDTYYLAMHGGLEAAGYPLQDHHSILVNRRTGHFATWVSNDPEFAHPSQDIYEVSSHPIAYPAMLAAFLLPFHPNLRQVQPDAALVMVLLAWAGALVTYLLARGVGMSRVPALCATAVLALASPWLVYTRSYYSEPAIGLAVALALWALQSGHPRSAGLAAGVAAIFKPTFALIGIGLVIERIWARRWRDAIQLSAMLAACGIALVSFNYWLARTPIISGNLVMAPGASFGHGLNLHLSLAPLYETMLGSIHGLLIYAPWTAIAFIALAAALFGDSSILRMMAVPTLAYLVLLSLTSIGPGGCYGPRYWVPLLPWLALASVEGIRSLHYPWPVRYALKISYLPVVAISAAIAILGALEYRQVFEQPVSDAWKNLTRQAKLSTPGEPGYRGEQYLLGNGIVRANQVTDAELSFEVDSPAQNVIVIDRPYDRKWRVVEGQGMIASSDGLLAVMVPQGKGRVVLAYQSRRFLIGLGSVAYLSLAMLLLWVYDPPHGAPAWLTETVVARRPLKAEG